MLIRIPFWLLLLVGALLFIINFLASSNNYHLLHGDNTPRLQHDTILNNRSVNDSFNNDGHTTRHRFITFQQILSTLHGQNGFFLKENDAIVFLHIQKTAGTTFERFLVEKLNITNSCVCNFIKKKRCDCKTKDGKIWLFSRFSSPGWACGIHADFTSLSISRCVDYYFQKKEGKTKSRMFLTTFLREPMARFISEYSHVHRGATWNRSRHFCNGREPTQAELPSCYPGLSNWKNVELDEFLSCEHNLAFNRQTRMLADLTLIGCYNKSTFNITIRDELMLSSAKKNLENIAFFGIKERMTESQFLFERTFGIRFIDNLDKWNKSKSAHIVVNLNQLNSIRLKNHLDFELYKFAQNLFNQRLILLGYQTTEPTQILF